MKAIQYWLEKCRSIDCRWIHTIKHKLDGTLDRDKTKLVAKRYTTLRHSLWGEICSRGIEYEKIFDEHGFDVKNAFLHGDSKKEVYMEIPREFDPTNGTNVVCKLKKTLYGLKQSPRAWFGRFSKAILCLGYKQSQIDHIFFFKHSHGGKMIVLLI